MADKLNKLQIRAKVLSVLSDLKLNNSFEAGRFNEQIKPLKDIQDKDFLFEILVKELQKADEVFSYVIKAIMVDIIGQDDLKERLLKNLASSEYTDSVKYHFLQILKDIGTMVEYETVNQYFEDFDSLLDYDTQKLLQVATFNPETQIDFLDFLTSLSDSDKMLLIKSFEEYDGDNLANILGPVLYLDFSQEIIETTLDMLGDTKSSIAIEPISHLQAVCDKITLSQCKNSLNRLKLAGATEEKAQTYYKNILSYSEIYRCYTTIPDGHSNQGFLISRLRKDNTCQMFAVVINYQSGIVDCFGFNNLDISEFGRIVDRFCRNDRKILVTEEYCKSTLQNAFEISQKNKSSYPYEFICWMALLKDVEKLSFDIKDYIEHKIEPKKIHPDELKYLYEKDYVNRWFFTASDNESFKKLVEKYLSTENFDIKNLEKDIETEFDNIWNKTANEELKTRIINSAYLLYMYIDKQDAKLLYSILFDEDILRVLKKDILKKSVYEYYLMCSQNIKDVSNSPNIFKAKREKMYDKIDIKRVKEIIKKIENKWID